MIHVKLKQLTLTFHFLYVIVNNGDVMKYELFFFKEGNRYLDLDELFSFFNYCPYITVDASGDEVEAKYVNHEIELEASFFLTKVSKVPDIYRLDPKFLDLDIYLSIDPMMPLYKVGIIMDLVSDLCQKFNFYVYNICFENVSSYRKDLVMKSYEMVRDAYRDKFPMEYTSMNYVPVEKCNDVFKYLYERKDLENYYRIEHLYFPIPYFVKSKNDGRVYMAVDLVYDEFFVFPPKCDLVFCKVGEYVKVISFDDLMAVIDKYCRDLPGFIHNTRILDKSGVKKIKKIINKTKFNEIGDTFVKLDLESIIDLK